MPFTISHAAIVLPFSRLLARWRLLSATVIGAMVPDFGQFFSWRMPRIETHSAMALLDFCLPVGLASYWVFQYVVKTPVLEVLPDGAYARSRPYAASADIANVRQWILAACGILAGAVTHLVWDAFTHEGARGVRMIPMLDDPVVDIGTHHVMGVRLMQDGTSLIGLLVVFGLLCYAVRRGHEPPVASRPLGPGERRSWTVAYAVTALACSVAWFVWVRLGEPPARTLNGVAISIAVAALRGFADALLGVSVALSLRLRLRTRVQA
jgi:hypothetical protein